MTAIHTSGGSLRRTSNTGLKLWIILSALTVVTAPARAQNPPTEGSARRDAPAPEEQTQSGEKKLVFHRLESVTWNPVAQQISWVVSSSDLASPYRPTSMETYAIDLDSATMTFHDEGRKFSEHEAARVGALMDLVSQYVIESTIRWEDGIGGRIDKEVKTIARGKDTEEPQLSRKQLTPAAGKRTDLEKQPFLRIEVDWSPTIRLAVRLMSLIAQTF